jgi:hypothetical protein
MPLARYSLASVTEERDGAKVKTLMRIKIPDNPPACDYSLLGTVYNVDAVECVEEQYEIKDPEDPKSKKAASDSNLAIKINANLPPNSSSVEYFALFFVSPDHANEPNTMSYIEDLQIDHLFQLGWLYKLHPNPKPATAMANASTGSFQIEPWVRATDNVGFNYANRGPEDKVNDPLHAYNFGYRKLQTQLQAKKPKDCLKVVLIPGRILLMPLYFKPDSLFVERSGNARELQLSPDKECFAIVAGVKPGAVFHSSIVSQIQFIRDALIKRFMLTGLSSQDVAIDPLAVFSFCSNKITDPDICRMLLSCSEDLAAVLGCRKRSKRLQDGLLYTHPDQINILWKLYGVGLAVEAFNRISHSSKSFSHSLHNISQQEVVDLSLKIHFVERVGSIFEIQQRVLLQCFDVMEVHNCPENPEGIVTFSRSQAGSLLNFLACMKREVFEPGVDEKDDECQVGRKVFRMPQNVSKIIRKFLRMSPPFYKARCSQLISEVVFMASTSLSLISRFIKQFTVFRTSDEAVQGSARQFLLLHRNSADPANVETSCCILQQVRSRHGIHFIASALRISHF